MKDYGGNYPIHLAAIKNEALLACLIRSRSTDIDVVDAVSLFLINITLCNETHA